MSRPIIALDFPDKDSVVAFLERFPKEESLFVKVGMELFYQEGPSIVKWLIEEGHDVFLDLKLHDIPNTVYSAMKGIARLGVSLTNVHAAGGKKMMSEALRGLVEGTLDGNQIPELIAVTQLTSTSDEEVRKDQLITAGLDQSVIHYAMCAKEAGLAGVVCSALEVAEIKSKVGADFVCLTPGIRKNSDATDDQKRIVTPKDARMIGSTYIVVGRPITKATDPYKAYMTIKKEWNGE